MRSYTDDTLVHHGVKGMKWGHRKARAESFGTSKPASRKKPNTQTKKASSKKKVDKGREECKRMLEALEAEEKARKIKSVSNLAGSMLVRHGFDTAGSFLSDFGSMRANSLSFGAGAQFWGA